MVQKAERFFIFTWKELFVISLLVIISMGFFFTLGLHYGKQLTTTDLQQSEPMGKLAESPEIVPNRETLETASRHSGAATEETIQESTKAAVEKTKIKVDAPKQVNLPVEKVEAKPSEAKPATSKPIASKQVQGYGIQLGSYPSSTEAQNRVKIFAMRGIEAQVHTAEVSKKTRYRVVMDGFKSKASAEQKAKELHNKNKIGSYVIIKIDGN